MIDFWSIFDRFLIIFRSFFDHFSIIFRSFFDHFWSIFDHSGGHFDPFLAHLAPFLAPGKALVPKKKRGWARALWKKSILAKNIRAGLGAFGNFEKKKNRKYLRAGLGDEKNPPYMTRQNFSSFFGQKWPFFVDFWRFLMKNGQKTRFLALNLQRKLTLRIYKENFDLKFAKFANEKNLQRKFCWKAICEIYKENGSKIEKKRAARRTFSFVNFENRQFFPAGYRTSQSRTQSLVARNSGPPNFPLVTIGFKVSLSPGLNRGFFAGKFDIFVFGIFSFGGSSGLDFWSKMGHFWSIFDHFSIIFRWFFDHFSIIFRSIFDRFFENFSFFSNFSCFS